MRSYPVPDWLQTDVGAASLRIESVEQVAVTASGNAAAWADRIVDSEYTQLCKALTAAGCGCEDDPNRYYGILDPEYPEPLVIAVVSLDPEEKLRRWNGEGGWDEVPPEYEPEGYPFISLDGAMLADALAASAGLLLRPTSPKGRIRSGALIAAANAATPGKTFAIVDEFDTNAVLELFEVRPGPKAFVRHDGEWALDQSILSRVQSVDPPRIVQLEPEQVDAIAKSVDEYDRAHADKAVTAARMMDDQYTTPKRKVPPRPKPKPKGDQWPVGTGIEAIGHMAKDIGKVGRRTGRASRRRTNSKFEEEKYNRVDGKFAPKGAADNHANDRKPGRGRGRSSSSRGKRIRVSQATVDELNRHSMAENIAKANSGKASPEFVEAARRFYPGKIKAQPASGGSGSSGGSSGRGKGSSAARKARAKAKRKGAKLTPADKKALELEAKEKAERVAVAKWEVRRKKSDLAESKRRGDFNDVVKKFYETFDPEKTTDDAMRRINQLVAAEQRRRDNYDRAAAYESEAESIRRLERRIKLGLIASVGDRALVAASPPERSMMPGKLKGYWVRGKGAAKIRWGTGGDFNRCRRALAKYLRPDQIGGACANLHKAATGTWPGKGRSHTASALAAAAYDGDGSMVSFRIEPELAGRLAENLEDGNPADEMHVTLAYLGEDVDPEVLNAAVDVVEGITAEYNVFPAYLGGRGQFLNDEVANYASVDSPNLEGFWADLTDRLGRAGVWFATDHGFTPHVTLKYGEMGEHEWPELPVRTSLGTIEVRSGGNVLSSRELLP